VVKVGSAEPLRVNTRIIAATNRRLEDLVAKENSGKTSFIG
jgi:transcriptional regulator with PAS, ATPase and Fis domain